MNLHLTAEMHQCLFIICFIVYNLYYCFYAKTSSPAAQIRHSKVYGNPIAPSLYSILLGIFKTSLYIYIFQDEKCRLMRNLSLSMVRPLFKIES